MLRRSALPSAFALLFLALPSLCGAFALPPNDGYYTQTTPILTPAQEAEIERMLGEEDRATGNQIAILAVESLGGEPIEDVANAVFRGWGVGQKGRSNGVLLFIATADHRMRIEVGYGLEGAVPDIVAAEIIERDIAPQFREGNYDAGLRAGIDSLRKHIAGEYTAERYREEEGAGVLPFALFFLFLFFNVFGAAMARSRSWWLGGILGAVFGVILAVFFAWWIAIPILAAFGLGVDYVVSRYPHAARRGRGFWMGGGGLRGGRGGGGGFGGFGGGSSGGGGASGRW